MDFGHLMILSFHNSQGARMDDTTTAIDTQILMPIQNRALADCRKQDMRALCLVNHGGPISCQFYPPNIVLN
jgi:hypothetical protein